MDVSKVTIVPSTSGAGGVNIIIPKKLGLYSVEELRNQIKMSYAGRCAERLLYGDDNKVTTGASNDIHQATNLIHEMISVYGMNTKYGMLNLNALKVDNKIILDEAVQMAIELEQETLTMLRNNFEFHQAIVDILMEKETISGDELEELYQSFKCKEPVVDAE
jgi:cell division protease FtsH